jgi:hypothetical protein
MVLPSANKSACHLSWAVLYVMVLKGLSIQTKEGNGARFVPFRSASIDCRSLFGKSKKRVAVGSCQYVAKEAP